tara:strand:+ start:3379 stop:4125 length:747 start_codon:yes stop_codon:yes gene_type:complete
MIEVSGRYHESKWGGKYIGTIKPLGDRFDYIAYCDTISKLTNKKVYMNLPIMRDGEEILKIFNNPNLCFGKSEKAKKITCTVDHMLEVFSEIPDWFKVSNFENPRVILPNLPKKYVTMQWDANQNYRVIDDDRKERIIEKYRDMGYDIVTIGGEATIPELKNGSISLLCGVISKARYHVGADSGTPHLAKVVLPTTKIHLYVNTNRTLLPKHNRRFPLGISISWMAFEIFKKGGRMNYVETYRENDNL